MRATRVVAAQGALRPFRRVWGVSMHLVMNLCTTLRLPTSTSTLFTHWPAYKVMHSNGAPQSCLRTFIVVMALVHCGRKIPVLEVCREALHRRSIAALYGVM